MVTLGDLTGGGKGPESLLLDNLPFIKATITVLLGLSALRSRPCRILKTATANAYRAFK